MLQKLEYDIKINKNALKNIKNKNKGKLKFYIICISMDHIYLYIINGIQVHNQKKK